ncbi:hypothetical protein TRAPUB_8593 [Trametes pubescens]|uniref:Uncharacterized protein n=1 Tax=Trametes pubescens TaxID=154538 RepID=A0A1M2W520_TRAPU|nr:hypothetical protein TRAPUB_8593 [Trametes pubescens]
MQAYSDHRTRTDRALDRIHAALEPPIPHYLTPYLEKVLFGFTLALLLNALFTSHKVEQLHYLNRLNHMAEARVERIIKYRFNLTSPISPSFDVTRTGTGLTLCTMNGDGLRDPTIKVVNFGSLGVCANVDDYAAEVKEGGVGCFAFSDPSSAAYFVATATDGL